MAFKDDRESFVDPKFPFVTSIDGVPVEKLIEPLGSYVAKGSPQYQLRHKLRAVRDLGLARELSDLDSATEVKIELANSAGEVQKKRLPVSQRYPTYGIWPRPQDSRILDNNIGYVRIFSMNGDAKNLVGKCMTEFAKTDGLIIDVRDNGGGTREALVELAAHLMKPEDTPRIANVCKYVLHRSHSEDHLESRFAFRADFAGFDARNQAAIQKFAKTFEPQWKPEAGRFSEWHYLVVSNPTKDPRPFYDKHVVILMNEKCFSATDIFLGAFKGWSNVTLVGQPSGGGSAKSESFNLPVSGCRVKCASIASFQPNGKLYDGNGIEPDVLVQPTPEYFLEGGDDPFIAKAMEVLSEKSN